MKYPQYFLQALLRKDFYSFINKTFNTINPGGNYEPNWHIDLIAEYLEAARNGEIKRLIINIPPRSLKSVCISVAWPAWLLGQKASNRIIAASYSQILSTKHSLDTKIIVTSKWYQKLFPKTILSKQHNQKNKFLTEDNGFRFATSVGGSVTGEGGEFLILDDPHNPAQIYSHKMRIKVIEWFEQTFLTRLNNKNTGVVIVVMQRLHPQDLSNYLLSSSGNWEHLKIPIHTNNNLSFCINNKKYTFNANTTLHTNRDQLDNILQLQKEIGTYNYAAQYLQEPLNDSHTLLKSSDIRCYLQFPEKFDYFIQSWDTAIKISENSDYSVCTCWGVINLEYYLVDMCREKLMYPDLKNKIEKLAKKYVAKSILIEDKASGQQIIQDLKYSLHNIVPIKPLTDKVTRFASVIPLFQSGHVLLPQNASFCHLVLNEITNFPNTKHDDIVDSISQFLNWIKHMSHNNNHRIRNL